MDALDSTSSHSLPPITARTWLIMAALAITGQIAWAVENAWFNTFVYEQLTPDPRPVAWMVAASAGVMDGAMPPTRTCMRRA
jgi:hypothetical protein